MRIVFKVAGTMRLPLLASFIWLAICLDTQAQVTNLPVCDFTQAEVLWDKRDEISQAITRFKTCTGVDLSIVLAYQHAPEDMQIYVEKWEEEGNGLLIALNPYGTNFEHDLKIVYNDNVINKTPGKSKQWLDERIFRAMMFDMIPILSDEDPLAHKDYTSVSDDGLPGGVVTHPGDVTGVTYQYGPRVKYGVAMLKGITALQWGCDTPNEAPLHLESIIMETTQYTGGRKQLFSYKEGATVMLYHEAWTKKFFVGERLSRQFPQGAISWEVRSYHDNSLLREFNGQNIINVDFQDLPWRVLLIAKYQEQQLVILIRRIDFRAFASDYRTITNPIKIQWEFNSVPDYEYDQWSISILTLDGPVKSQYENIKIGDQPYVWRPHYRDLKIGETYPPGKYYVTVRLIEKATNASMDQTLAFQVDGGVPLKIQNLIAVQTNPWIASIGGRKNVRQAGKGEKLYVTYHPPSSEHDPQYKPLTYVKFEPVFDMPVRENGWRIPEKSKFWNDEPQWVITNKVDFIESFAAEKVTEMPYDAYNHYGLRAIAFGNDVAGKRPHGVYLGSITADKTTVSYSAFSQTYYAEVIPIPYARTPVTIDFLGSRLLKKNVDIKKWIKGFKFAQKITEMLNRGAESLLSKIPEDGKALAELLLKVECKADITFNAETFYEERPFSPSLDTAFTLVAAPSASLTLKKELPKKMIDGVKNKIAKAIDWIPFAPPTLKQTLKDSIKINAGLSIGGGGSARWAVDFYNVWHGPQASTFDVRFSNSFSGKNDLTGSIYVAAKTGKIAFDFPMIGKKEIIDAGAESKLSVTGSIELKSNLQRDKVLGQFCLELPRRLGIEYGVKVAGFTILEKQFFSFYDFTDDNRPLKSCTDPAEILDLKTIGL